MVCGLPGPSVVSRFLDESSVTLQAVWAALKGEGWEHLCSQRPGWLERAGLSIGGWGAQKVKGGPDDGGSLTNSPGQ